MKAKVLCVYDEGSIENTPLIGAKGLSMLIDVDEQRTMFDVGRKGNYLIHNMEHLELSLDCMDRIVISHGHRDHVGALNHLLRAKEETVTIYAHRNVWEPKSSSVGGLRLRNIGAPAIDDDNQSKAIIQEAEGWVQLSEHLFIMSLPLAEPDGKHKRLVDGKWVDDNLSDEIALVLMTRKGPVLFTGCAHTGLVNALNAVKERTGKEVATVVGGVHMIKMKGPQIDGISAALLNDMTKTPQLYLNHCSAPDSKTRLRTKLGLGGVREFYVGMELEFDV